MSLSVDMPVRHPWLDAPWHQKIIHQKEIRQADQEFLGKVRRGEESFQAGDVLRVRLHTVQERIGDKVDIKYEVEKVIAHEHNREKQIDML